MVAQKGVVVAKLLTQHIWNAAMTNCCLKENAPY